MRKCNICGQKKLNIFFKNSKKKTCRHCEFRWYRSFLRYLVKSRKLSPIERIGNRLGYMGTGFFVTAPHMLPDTVGVVIYFLAGLFCIPQVWVAKQWNLVIVNLNVMIAYALLFFK